MFNQKQEARNVAGREAPSALLNFVDKLTQSVPTLRRALFLVACATFLNLFLLGCNPPTRQQPPTPTQVSTSKVQPTSVSDSNFRTASVSFVDVARERGLDFEWPKQPRPMTALDAFGAGCAAFDADNDGWQDILLITSPHPVLFRNEKGRFQNVTAPSGLESLSGHWTGCAMGDFDGDGLRDLLITGYHQLALWKNLGDFHFEDVTTKFGLDRLNHEHWGASAAWMDLDNDGWLDLVLLNYVIYGPDSQKYCEYGKGVISGCGPRTYLPERGEIWKNIGGQKLEIIPDSQGMADTHGIGLVLAFTDLDDDGRIDFYIGNDGVAADVLYNRGDFHFENIGLESGLSQTAEGGQVASMGADWADFDRDGYLDLALSNWQSYTFVYFHNLGSRLFSDCSKETRLASLTKNNLGFGTKWCDFDNDGWPDLHFVNGHVYDASVDIVTEAAPLRQPSLFLWNDRGKQFVDITPQMPEPVRRPLLGRGSATLDFNNDGRLDLLAVDYEGPVVLLENRSQTTNHWITLDLHARPPNRFAHGAKLTARAKDQVFVAEVTPTSSYLSSSDPRIHWGLGDLATIDHLTIRWPSGATQELTNLAADQILQIQEPTSETGETPRKDP